MDLVISVGGGGQHIALAVARLLRLGALAEPMEAYVLDADGDGRLGTRLRTFGNTVSAGCPHPLPGASVVVPPFARDTLRETAFRRLFLDERADPLARELFELFYDEESGGVDGGVGVNAGVDVGKGMFANPSVGSAVFAASKAGAMEPLFGHARTAARIFVVGSFLGGTGAGITHQLIKLLREAVGPAKPIFGSFLLRWFELPPSGGQTVDTATLLASMGHGLEYFYAHTRPLLDASLLVGVPDHPTPQLRAVPAAPDNDESPSLYPLLAAYGLLLLPEKTDVQARATHRTYGLAHDEQSPAWPLERAWSLPKGARDASLGARLVEAQVVEEVYASFRQKESDFVSAGYERARSTWATTFAAAAKEAHEKDAVFARRVLQALEARAAQLHVATEWFAAIFGDADLAAFGERRARELHALRRQRRWRAPDAFRLFADAFVFETASGVDAARAAQLPAEAAMAWKIERALLAAMRS